MCFFVKFPVSKQYFFMGENKMKIALPGGIGYNQDFNITVRLSAEQAGRTLFFALIIFYKCYGALHLY